MVPRLRLRERLALLASQALNALCFSGDPDESLSARAWREYLAGTPGWQRTWRRIDRWLGAHHCRNVHNLQIARENTRRNVK